MGFKENIETNQGISSALECDKENSKLKNYEENRNKHDKTSTCLVESQF